MTSMLSNNKVLVKTNVKRYFPLFAFGLVLLFLCVIYPTFFIDGPNQVYIQRGIDNLVIANTGMIVYELIMPILTSVVLFSYLHKENSVLALHSQPFSRQTIFNSYFTAGLILLLVPILIIGAWVMVITNVGLGVKWIAEGVVGVSYVYSIATLGGILSGNMLMHVFNACFLNGAATAIFALYQNCCDLFLYGYSRDYGYNIVLKLSPVTAIAVRGYEKEYYIQLGIYLLLAVVWFVLASFLYRSLRLERVTESITFNAIKPVYIIILTLIGPTALGLIFGYNDYAGKEFFIALAIGWVVTFAFAYMVVNKTFSIFTAKALKTAIASGLVIVVAFSALVLDPFNYQERRPKIDEIKGVKVDELMGSVTEYMDRFKDDLFYKNGEKEVFLTSKEVVTNYLKLHKSIIDNMPRKRSKEFTSNYINIEYSLKNGKRLVRDYYTVDEKTSESEYIKNIYESKEFKDVYCLSNIKREYLKHIVVVNPNNYDFRYAFKNQKEIDELIKAFDKDFKARTFEQQQSKAVLNLESNNNTAPYMYVCVEVKKSDKNTLAFLRSKGIEV